MITPIKVTGIDYKIDEPTRKYAIKRIGRLDRYIPRHARKSASADIRLTQVNHAHGNKYEAEVVVHVPGKTLTAKDSTGNALAAIDIVEAKMQNQLRDYKQTTVNHISQRGIMARFKRSFKRG